MPAELRAQLPRTPLTPSIFQVHLGVDMDLEPYRDQIKRLNFIYPYDDIDRAMGNFPQRQRRGGRLLPVRGDVPPARNGAARQTLAQARGVHDAQLRRASIGSATRQKIGDVFIRRAEQLIPHLGEHIVTRAHRTPLDLQRDTGNADGAFAGWSFAPEQLSRERPFQRTPVPGLYLAGHWTTPSAGVPWVMLSGYNTASMVLGDRARGRRQATRRNEMTDPFARSWREHGALAVGGARGLAGAARRRRRVVGAQGAQSAQGRRLHRPGFRVGQGRGDPRQPIQLVDVHQRGDGVPLELGHRRRPHFQRPGHRAPRTACPGVHGVRNVQTFYSNGNPLLVSADRHTTFALVPLEGNEGDIQELVPDLRASIKRRIHRALPHWHASRQQRPAVTSEEDLQRSEKFTVPIVIILLLLVFRTAVAAVLPLLIGACSIVLALGSMYLVSTQTEVSIFALNVTTMIGLGLGIDFSLVLANRFREELAGGRSVERIGRDHHGHRRAVDHVLGADRVAGDVRADAAVQPAGRRSISLGVMLVAFTGLLAGMTLLPALLASSGIASSGRASCRAAQAAPTGPPTRAFWYRLSMAIMRRPWVWLAVSLGILLILALPVRELTLYGATAGHHAPRRRVDPRCAGDERCLWPEPSDAHPGRPQGAFGKWRLASPSF